MGRIWPARVGVVAAYGGVAATGQWALIRLAGWDSHYPAAQLMAFTPYVAVAATLGATVLWALRRWWLAGAATAVALVLVGCVLPRGLTDGDTLAGADGPTVRVATANLLFGTAEPADLVATVIRQRLDVLAVQEMTPQWLVAADVAGLAALMPYRIAVPADGASGSAVFARYPIEATGHREEWFYQAFGVVRLPDGHTVRVESAHAASPYDRSNTPHWANTLRHEPQADPKALTPQVLLGDFNATLDHSLLRRLIASGYRDAASVAGKGWTGTWGSYDGDPIPPVIIDHVLADRRIGVRGVYVYPIEGSDHRMVVAELVLP